MTTVNVYLVFNGNCEEAFDRYKKVFGGEFASINRFGEMPPHEGMPPMPADMKSKIMHVSLPISKETSLMGSDTSEGFGANTTAGNNFSIAIHTDSREKADRYFKQLSDGGSIQMPLQETFWGAYWGMCTDRFGIGWQVNVNLKV
jgi:PhnB protein